MLTAQGSVAVWGGNGGNRWQSLDNSIACVPVLVFVFDCAFILHCVSVWLCCPLHCAFFVCVRLLLCAWDFHSTFWYNSRQLYWLCSLSYVCIWFCFCFHFATWLYSSHFKCFFQILLCSTISFYKQPISSFKHFEHMLFHCSIWEVTKVFQVLFHDDFKDHPQSLISSDLKIVTFIL